MTERWVSGGPPLGVSLPPQSGYSLLPQPWSQAAASPASYAPHLHPSPRDDRVAQAERQLQEQRQFFESKLADLEARLAAVEARGEGSAGAPAPGRASTVAVVGSRGFDKHSLLKDVRSEDSSSESTSDEEHIVTGEMLDSTNVYELEETAWDCCIFIGADFVSPAMSAGLLVVTLLNMAVQVSFCWIVWTAMLDDPYNGELLSGLLHFRAGIAHDVTKADHVSGRSLATMLCGQDQKIPISGQKVSLVEEINGAKEHGKYLCFLALLCWVVTMMGELEATYHYILALWSLPRGRTQIVHQPSDDGGMGNLSFASISNGRFVLVVLLSAVPRTLVGLALGYIGCHYLVITSKMEDLVLNAVALAFVIDIDDVIFRALAPARARLLQKRLEPLKLPHQRRVGHRTWLKLAAVGTLLTLLYVLLLDPFYARMNMAYDILCGGNINFVTAVNPSSGLVEVAGSKSEGSEDMTYWETAVLQLAQPPIRSIKGWEVPGDAFQAIQTEPQDYWSTFMHTPQEVSNIGKVVPVSDLKSDRQTFAELARLSTETVQASASNAVCRDHAATMWNKIASSAILKEVTGQPDADCLGLVDRCGWKNMTALRAICPETCGCSRLLHPPAGFFASQSFGCPNLCLMRLERRLRNAEVTCVDQAAEEFLQNQSLRTYIDGVLEHITSEGDFVYGVARAAVASHRLPTITEEGQMLRWLFDGGFRRSVQTGQWELVPGLKHPRGLTGCQFWTSWEVEEMLGMDLCADGAFRTLRAICPQACGCLQAFAPECPAQCSPTKP